MGDYQGSVFIGRDDLRYFKCDSTLAMKSKSKADEKLMSASMGLYCSTSVEPNRVVIVVSSERQPELPGVYDGRTQRRDLAFAHDAHSKRDDAWPQTTSPRCTVLLHFADIPK